MDSRKLNPLANAVIKAASEDVNKHHGRGMTVNPIVSKIASLYERLRNAMDYRDEEVILRAAIERILKRRFLLNKKGQAIASPLIRELIWARYFADGSIPESVIEKVAHTIDLYSELQKKILAKHKISEGKLGTLIYQLLSSEIQYILNPNKEKQALANLMYHIISKNISITDDTEETKNAQVFIGVRRAFARDDLALIYYHLYQQFFGKVTETTLEHVAQNFAEGYKQIERQLNHPLTIRVYVYVKRLTPPFLILEDIIRNNKEKIEELLENEESFNKAVFDACQTRYSAISSKVRTAIIRSIIFILLSKAFFALAIEGTFENYVYGKVVWRSIALNVIIPPILMAIFGLFIKTPDRDNTLRILGRIKSILFDDEPLIGYPLVLKVAKDKTQPVMAMIFSLLWFTAFILSFGLIIYILSKLHFNLISQFVFIFFLAIVAFLTYRIYRIAHTYTLEDKQSYITPIVDLFFMPVAQVGRYLTEGISQINIFIFILDFIIETPFKGIFGFVEQLFFFLHSKRENLE